MLVPMFQIWQHQIPGNSISESGQRTVILLNVGWIWMMVWNECGQKRSRPVIRYYLSFLWPLYFTRWRFLASENQKLKIEYRCILWASHCADVGRVVPKFRRYMMTSIFRVHCAEEASCTSETPAALPAYTHSKGQRAESKPTRNHPEKLKSVKKLLFSYNIWQMGYSYL